MSRWRKTLDKILRGTSDANVGFDELCQLLNRLGFDLEISGSHHKFSRSDIEEILVLQPKNSKAKPYQVKQVREVLVSHGLSADIEEDA